MAASAGRCCCGRLRGLYHRACLVARSMERAESAIWSQSKTHLRRKRSRCPHHQPLPGGLPERAAAVGEAWTSRHAGKYAHHGAELDTAVRRCVSRGLQQAVVVRDEETADRQPGEWARALPEHSAAGFMGRHQPAPSTDMVSCDWQSAKGGVSRLSDEAGG